MTDEAAIFVQSGNGGAGSVSFRREKYVPLGGPDGGNGGDGGDVIITACREVKTLSHLHTKKRFTAENGKNGKGRLQSGAKGKDMCISLPLGAVVYNAETHQQLADLVKAGEHIIVLRGGRGGRGNHHFRSSTYRSPRFSQKGESGQNLTLHIELRLIADIGLVGAPNAGKSTLLACLTNSPAKIGCYPFTTLTPNLGVLRLEYQELIIADLPGFIEGASKGAGLGIRFLKHASRTRYLAFVIEATDMQPKQTYEGLLQEIRNFSVELAEKSHLIILSKADLLTAQEQKNQDNAVIFPAVQTFLVSSHTHYNIEPLKKAFFSFNHGEKA